MHDPSSTAAGSEQSLETGEKVRILIVDDEFDAADGVREILEMEGHITGIAEDKRTALEAARMMSPDIAFVDLRLREEWGLDVIHALHQEFSELLCIVQTGNSDSSVVINALRQGVYDYLVKPFEPDQLLTVVERAAEKVMLQKERREMIARLSNAHDQAEFASRTKTEFLTRMGSELSDHFETLVTLANSMAQEQFGPLNDQSYALCAKGIASGCARMLDNMKNIGQLGLLEAGKVVPKFSRFAVLDVIQELAGEFEEALASRQLGASAAISEDMPDIESDRVHFTAILRHLLSNAVKFAPAGSTIHISANMDNKGALEISIADQGPGIAADKMALAMAPFGQLEHNREGDEIQDDPLAAGLGLPLASQLADLLGGAIALSQNAPKGTVARVHFPGEAVFEFAKQRTKYL